MVLNKTPYVNYIDCLLIAYRLPIDCLFKALLLALSIADRYGPGAAPCTGAAGPSVRGAGGPSAEGPSERAQRMGRGRPGRGPYRSAIDRQSIGNQ